MSAKQWDAAADTTITLEARSAKRARSTSDAMAGALMISARLRSSAGQPRGNSSFGRISGFPAKGMKSAKLLFPMMTSSPRANWWFSMAERLTSPVWSRLSISPPAGKLKLIGIDSYGATGLSAAFADCGAEVMTVPQGWKLTPAITWIERTLADDNLRHSGTTVMRWNVGNVVVSRRGNGFEIGKATVVGSGKIDGRRVERGCGVLGWGRSRGQFALR